MLNWQPYGMWLKAETAEGRQARLWRGRLSYHSGAVWKLWLILEDGSEWHYSFLTKEAAGQVAKQALE